MTHVSDIFSCFFLGGNLQKYGDLLFLKDFLVFFWRGSPFLVGGLEHRIYF